MRLWLLSHLFRDDLPSCLSWSSCSKLCVLHNCSLVLPWLWSLMRNSSSKADLKVFCNIITSNSQLYHSQECKEQGEYMLNAILIFSQAADSLLPRALLTMTLRGLLMSKVKKKQKGLLIITKPSP